MMNVKHTPGPWHVGEQKDYFWQLRNDKFQFVASVPAGSAKYQVDVEKKKADAHLISAAPELLEALKLCSAELFAKRGDKVGSMKIVNKAREAIRKAQGETDER